MIRFARLSTLVAAGAALAFAGLSTSSAQDLKLPSTLTFTAYDTGSSGFNIAVAVGKMFKDKHNTDVRVLPAGNDVARLAPLKANRAQVSAMGVASISPRKPCSSSPPGSGARSRCKCCLLRTPAMPWAWSSPTTSA